MIRFIFTHLIRGRTYLRMCLLRSDGDHFLDEFSSIADADFDFQNSLVKIVLIREIPFSHPVVDNLRPKKVGQEAEVPFWVADELINAGFAKLQEDDQMDFTKLSKTHWRETIPSSTQLPQLQSDFYCILRRYLSKLKAEGKRDSSKLREYERAESLSRDIISCRLRKIASFAAAPGFAADLLKSMTREERTLYERMRDAANDWKAAILESESQ